MGRGKRRVSARPRPLRLHGPTTSAQYDPTLLVEGPDGVWELLPGGGSKGHLSVRVPGAHRRQDVFHVARSRFKHPSLGTGVLRRVRRRGDEYLLTLDFGDEDARNWREFPVGAVKLQPLRKQADPRPRSKVAQSKKAKQRLQGSFNHHLTKYAELLVLNGLVAAYQLAQGPFADDKDHRGKIEAALQKAESQFDEQGWRPQLALIETALSAERLRALFDPKLRSRLPVAVQDVSADTSAGKAADLQLLFADGDLLPVSIKTHTEHRVAVSGNGQTSLENMALAFYGQSAADLEALAQAHLGCSLAATHDDFLQQAELLKRAMVSGLGLVGHNDDPWDLREASVTSLAGAQRLFDELGLCLFGTDSCDVLVIDRVGGGVDWVDCVLLDLPRLEQQDLAEIKFSTSSGVNPAFRFRGEKVADHQVKEGRQGGLTTRVGVR